MVNTFILDKDWVWKQRRSDDVDVLDEQMLDLVPEANSKSLDAVGWRPTQAYPSEIHVELLKAGLIPDPYVGFNEHKVQWIGLTEWLYKTTFSFAAETNHNHAALEFLGLDTICDVYLNDEKILEASNQFQTHIVPIPLSSLKPENTLLLHFKSAQRLAKEIEAVRGKVRAGSNNLGDPSRVYVRKAQYDWRWDWGPELMTVGPYRPIALHVYSARISDVNPKSAVDGQQKPSLKIDVTVEGDAELQGFRVSLSKEDGTLIQEHTTSSASSGDNSNIVDWELKDKVALWWPVGYGSQTLYILNIALLGPRGTVLDSYTKKIGFRSVAVIQEELKEPDQYGAGTTFLFEINGVRIFCGGSNWIPADNFLTTISPERYRSWLTLMRDGNQNMVRIWGGGIYEPDVFYDICDELGLLVWQDFQFACGVYPAYDEFVASVKKEAEDNVKRLRHHPSVALFCGNNEDYQMILQWGDVKDFPAIKIYEEVLPAVVEALTSPTIPYHRGSPYGGKDWDTADPTVGDVHQWNVWGGKELPYQDYDKLGGRFVSEFGMPAMPSMKTIEYWMDGAPQTQYHAQSAIMAQHCRAGLFERRFAIAMNDNFRLTTDLETAMYNTQLMQSEAVGHAYQSWRRAWKGRGKEYTSGVLVWQLNDCWPVTSWAIADYFLRPKPVYYTIARHLAPFAVGAFRTVTQNRTSDRPRQFYEYGAYQSRSAKLDVWAVNGTLEPKTVILEFECYDLKLDGWHHFEAHKDIVLPPNQSLEILTQVEIPAGAKDAELNPSGGDGSFPPSHSVVVGLRLVDPETKEVLARHSDWPQPYRFLELPDAGLKVTVKEETGEVTLKVKQPVKGLVLQAVGDGPDEKWSDNGLDLLPSETRVIEVQDLNGRKIAAAYLGKEKASAV